MELLTLEQTADFFQVKGTTPAQRRKVIVAWLYNKTLPRELTVKVGRHVFFVKESLEKFLTSKQQNEMQA